MIWQSQIPPISSFTLSKKLSQLFALLENLFSKRWFPRFYLCIYQINIPSAWAYSLSPWSVFQCYRRTFLHNTCRTGWKNRKVVTIVLFHFYASFFFSIIVWKCAHIFGNFGLFWSNCSWDGFMHGILRVHQFISSFSQRYLVQLLHLIFLEPTFQENVFHDFYLCVHWIKYAFCLSLLLNPWRCVPLLLNG